MQKRYKKRETEIERGIKMKRSMLGWEARRGKVKCER